MIRFVITFFITFVLWIVFTLSFEFIELLLGVFIATTVALLVRKVVFHGKATKFLSPMRWGALVFYLLVFCYIEIRSHLDVAYRIITGNIRPALIELPTKMRSDAGKTLLGNSITLTPGTLTVKIEGNLLVHWIAYKKKERPALIFEKLGRMITE